jgi:hypothetical protein
MTISPGNELLNYDRVRLDEFFELRIQHVQCGCSRAAIVCIETTGGLNANLSPHAIKDSSKAILISIVTAKGVCSILASLSFKLDVISFPYIH